LEILGSLQVKIYCHYLDGTMPEKVNTTTKKTGRNKNPEPIVRKKIRSIPDKNIRLKIINALIRVEEAWVNRVLLDTLDDPCEKIRDVIILELSQRENLDIKQVYKKLGGLPWYVKSSSLRILGSKKNPRTVNKIEAVIDDPNVDVRRTAAHVLGEIGGREALALLAVLVQDKNRIVRKSAEQALEKASNIKFI
jgi:HEAT repeat protein